MQAACTAVDLQRFVGDLARGALGEELHLGDLAERVIAARQPPQRVIRESARGLQPGQHLRETVRPATARACSIVSSIRREDEL